MGKQYLNFQDSYYTVEFTFGTISFLLSALSVLLLYLTRRRSGFTYFNGLVLHQFIAQMCFDWCNVMAFFVFLKGFGPNVDDDYYYDYYDDHLDKYREDWFVGVSFFYQFGGLQTSIFAAVIMGVITYMVAEEKLLDLKVYYPYFFVMGFVLPFILSLCRILFFYPLTDKYYFSGPHGPSALYYIINVYRNLAILFMVICNIVLYQWLRERKDMNPQITRLVASVRWYPVIEILVRIVYYIELIDDVQYHNKNERDTNTIVWFVTIFNSLQGSAYFFVFLNRDEEAYSYLVGALNRLFHRDNGSTTEIEIQDKISQPKSRSSKRRVSVQDSLRGGVYGDDDSDVDETELNEGVIANPMALA